MTHPPLTSATVQLREAFPGLRVERYYIRQAC